MAKLSSRVCERLITCRMSRLSGQHVGVVKLDCLFGVISRSVEMLIISLSKKCHILCPIPLSFITKHFITLKLR